MGIDSQWGHYLNNNGPPFLGFGDGIVDLIFQRKLRIPGANKHLFKTVGYGLLSHQPYWLQKILIH